MTYLPDYEQPRATDLSHKKGSLTVPTITIDIDNAGNLTRAVDATCAKFNYQTLINGVANPETRNQFAKRMVALTVKGWIAEYEGELAAITARAAVGSVGIT